MVEEKKFDMENLIKQMNLQNGDKKQFKIVQWNILADSLCNQSKYGFPFVDKNLLDWKYRGEIFKKILQLLDVDIFAFQECDQYEFFKTVLTQLYNNRFKNSVIWQKKYNSAKDGLLVAINEEKFKICEQQNVRFQDEKTGKHMDQFFMFFRLQYIGDLKDQFSENGGLLFYSTHLKASPEFSETRITQTNWLSQHIEAQKLIFPNYNIIVVGDFNDDYDSSCMQNLISKNAKTYFKNVYEGQLFTTLKYRKQNEQQCYNIDYILYHNQQQQEKESNNYLKCIDILEMPKDKSVFPFPGLPSAFIPSDHLPLLAVFNLSTSLQGNL